MVQRAFEIQQFRSGMWKINSVFDDSELACFEARRMFESGLYSGVRVIEETFDDKTGNTRSRTLYNSTKIEQHNKKVARQQSEVRQEAAINREKRAADRANKKKKKSFGTMQILLLLFALAGSAIGAMIGLQLLQQFF